MAAAFFACVVLDTSAKLKVVAGYVLKSAKRLFGVPDFHYYAIADGLTSIFQRCPGRINAGAHLKNTGQLRLLGEEP